MTIAYLDCFSGVSGDMFLAAMVDAGVPVTVLQQAVDTLHLGVRLDLRRVNRSGIDSAKIDVLTSDGKLAEPIGKSHSHDHDHPHPHEHGHSHDHTHEPQSHSHNHEHSHGRSLRTIRELIHKAALAEPVQRLAISAFDLLGHAEAKIHNIPVETIHFHEVGSVDAIADIVAAAAGCHWLATERKVERWLCSPLNVGGGHIHCAHGKFPVPAPATLELLHGLPIYSSGVQKELLTPTGAALLRALNVSSTNFPAMRMLSTGYGAGTRDLPGQPNVLRLVIGESSDPRIATSSQIKEKVGVIETTIDDATPELLSYVSDRLLTAGASDVYRTPVQMKKGRSGALLTILCSPNRAPELEQIVFLESTTLGLRYREEDKFILDRAAVAVETQWGAVRIKLGLAAGKVINAAPEFEDCKRIAQEHAIALKHVVQAAMASYSLQTPEEMNQRISLQESYR